MQMIRYVLLFFFFFFVLFGILNSVDWFLFTRGFDVLSGEGRDFLCTR